MLYVLGLAGLCWLVYATMFTAFFTPGVVALCAYGTCVAVSQLVLFMPGRKI